MHFPKTRVVYKINVFVNFLKQIYSEVSQNVEKKHLNI